MEGKTTQHVEHPEVRIIGCEALSGINVILHIAVQAAVIKEILLAYGKAVVSYQDHGIIHEHIHKTRTQFLTGLVSAREKLLIVARCHIARQLHGLVQMVADGITDHLGSPVLNRRIGLICRDVTSGTVPVHVPIPDISFCQEGMT